MCPLFTVFTLFYLILEDMSANVTSFINWFISQLPPIVLDNQFGGND